MTRSYNGYCFDKDGRYSSPVKLNGPAEVFDFCQQNKGDHYEIRIVEPVEDAIIVKVINGKYVHPEEWEHFNV